MIKVVEMIKRRPDLDVEPFQHHWLHTHGPIVARIPGLRRYVQSHTRLGGYRRNTGAGEPSSVPYDGIAELWFDDKEALAAITSTEEFAAAKRDEPNFIDLAPLVELVVDEHIIKDGPTPEGGIKNIEFVHLSPALDPEEAHRYWREVHGPIAARIPTMSRYVQSHTRMGAYGRPTRPPLDGIAVTWWADLDAMRASAAGPEYAATRADEANFLGDEPEVILTTEHVIVGWTDLDPTVDDRGS
ncbi:MAG: EthD domain-containing protein [Acidimicrobiales bacterium]